VQRRATTLIETKALPQSHITTEDRD